MRLGSSHFTEPEIVFVAKPDLMNVSGVNQIHHHPRHLSLQHFLPTNNNQDTKTLLGYTTL
jgi:hypothetical protein